MKRLLYTLAAAALAVSWGAVRADVVGSVHDLTTATGGAFSTTGDTAEVCVFCHTPHGGDSARGPLWNRGAPAAGYTMYSSATLDMTIAGSPQGVSAACLSCHDGTVGFDVLINAPTSVSGTYNYTAAGADQTYTFTGADSLSGRTVTDFTQDLSNQHPISVTYDPGQDADFDTIANAEADGIVFFGSGGDQVECGSCHDPHDKSTAVPFLRFSNAASALCRACHLK